MKQYVIKWVSQLTGYSGQSSPMVNREIAQAWADKMNQEHPEISHWVEEADEENTGAQAPAKK